MNVLILNWKDIKHPEVGGAEIILYELAKRLVKDGHEVNWFCRSFPEGKRFESVDQIKIVRILLFHISDIWLSVCNISLIKK